MRSLLTLLGAAVVTFAVVGWFLGWYQVKTTPGSDGHREVNIDFNEQKFKEDVKKGEDRIFKTTQQVSGAQTVPATSPSGALPLPNPTAGTAPQPLRIPGASSNVNPTSAVVPASTFSLPRPPSPGNPAPEPVPSANLAWPTPQQ